MVGFIDGPVVLSNPMNKTLWKFHLSKHNNETVEVCLWGNIYKKFEEKLQTGNVSSFFPLLHKFLRKTFLKATTFLLTFLPDTRNYRSSLQTNFSSL